MDLLKKELERKKQEISAASRTDTEGRRRRYRRSGGETVSRELPRGAASTTIAGQDPSEDVSSHEHCTKRQKFDRTETLRVSDGVPLSEEVQNLDDHNVSLQFRKLGLPTKIFGENSIDRKQRLQKSLNDFKETIATLSAKDEFRLDKEHRIRNTFLAQDSKKNSTSAGSSPKKGARSDTHSPEEELPTDPFKRIYKYFRNRLDEWEEELEQRSESVKSSLPGRNETKTYQQCKDYIRPLFKECKNKTLEESILKNLNRIIDFCLLGEFVKAHDAYLLIAIGRSPWPIGVTQVGIHSRTGRSKIESQNVAHVMNSELQRKYLTSVKRLMTYAQTKREDVHHSKKVL